MCLPVSVLTQGRVTGCSGVCNLWPYIGGLAALFAGMVWNFRETTRRFISRKVQGQSGA